MVFEDRMHDIIDVLENDGVILFPTDTLWALGCGIQSRKACLKLKKIPSQAGYPREYSLLASGIPMIKQYIPRVHPRIETLLVYHHQPLTVVHPGKNSFPDYIKRYFPGLGFNLTNDPFCKTIIRLLGFPLIITPAQLIADEIPNSFDRIDPHLHLHGDYICKHKMNLMNDHLPPVTITYNEEGDLIFLRE